MRHVRDFLFKDGGILHFSRQNSDSLWTLTIFSQFKLSRVLVVSMWCCDFRSTQALFLEDIYTFGLKHIMQVANDPSRVNALILH